MKTLDEYEIAVKYGYYIERDVYDQLLDWKNNDAREHKCLFLSGARRVGKSCLALEFAHREYSSFIKISFDQASEDIKNLFVNSLNDLDNFYDQLSIVYDTKLIEGKSLIILDEIQLFKPARQAIKTLLLDGRYDILETGSLASIVKKRKDETEYLLPSEEIKINVNPISFKEYLKVSGKSDLVDFISKTVQNKKTFGATLKTIEKEFRNYLFVGGMPKCITTYLKTKSLVKTAKEKRSIINLYYDDFSRQENVNSMYLTSIFNLIPSELSQHDKVFTLSHASSNAREREYGPAFKWLVDAYIINICMNATEPSVVPLLNARGNDIKAYFLDTGLLYTLSSSRDESSELFYKSMILDRLHVNEGMYMENYVAQVLKNKGYNTLFFYQERDPKTHKSKMEIDFLAIVDQKTSPIEVKSSDINSLSSLKKFKTQFTNRVGREFVVYQGDFRVEENITYIPIFSLDWYF